MTQQPALVVDLIRRHATDGTGVAVRQLVFTKAPAPAPAPASASAPAGGTDSDRYIILSRQITPTAAAKHWKRWPVEGSSLGAGPESWLSEYMRMHVDRGFQLASMFCIEVSDADWEDLSEKDATPRALMVRIDRARDSLGGSTFAPEPRYADPDAVDTIPLVQEGVGRWRVQDPAAPELAPAGRIRVPRTPAAKGAGVGAGGAGADAAGRAQAEGVEGVAPGTHVVLEDGTIYVTRRLDGELSDVDLLRRGRAAGAYALLYSVPGTGKTRATQAAFGPDLIEMLGTDNTEVSDFVGNYVPTGRPGVYRWMDGPLVRAMDEGRPLLVDEIALVDPRTLTVLYSAMDGRREINVTMNPARGKVTARDGFYVVGAFNPGAPGARISEALVSRFALQVEYSTDFDIMESLGVPRTFVLAAKNLDTKRLNDEISVSPQARECLDFKLATELFGESVALRNVVASSPEADRGVVADVLSRSFGRRIDGLRTG